MEFKTCLLVVHLFGLILGLGAVTTLDIYFLKFLRGAIVSSHDLAILRLVAVLAALGLLLLWLSGLGFLLTYWMDAPELLDNAKLHAKVAIVGVLTLNGALLHARVMPAITRAEGRPLLADPTPARDRRWLRVCGAVSVASWWTPFVLGAVRELNFTHPLWIFLVAYAGVVASVGGAMVALEIGVNRRILVSSKGPSTPGYSSPTPQGPGALAPAPPVLPISTRPAGAA